MASNLDPERPRALDLSGPEADSEQHEQILFPTFWNRVMSSVVDKTVEVTHSVAAARDGLERSGAEKKPENETHDSEGTPKSPKCQTAEEQQAQARRRTTDNPEFVIKNQAVASSAEEQSDDEVIRLANIIEVVRSAGPNSPVDAVKRISLPASKEPTSPIKEHRKRDEASESTLSSPREPSNHKGRLYSQPEGSFFNLATFLPIRLMDTISKTASTGNDTPRIEDLDTELDFSAQDASTPRSLDQTSYYVFEPNSGDIAHYLYPNPDQRTESRVNYLMDSVPLEVVSLTAGGSAYQVRVSPKDQTLVRPSKEKEELSENGLTPGQIIHGEGSADSDAQNSVLIHKLQDDEQDDIWQGLISKVVDRLRVRRHMQDHVSVLDDSGKHIQKTEGMYLVSDSDIHRVVRAVVEELQFGEQLEQLEDRVNPKESQCPSRPKPDGIAHRIMLPAGTVAEPATTISVPKTAFTAVRPSDEQICTKTRDSNSNVTMIVSRKSIAEITWTSPHSSREDLADRNASTAEIRSISQCSSPSHRASTVYSSSRRQSQPSFTLSRFSVQHYTVPSISDLLAADDLRSRSRSETIQTSTGSAITSFPKLPSRNCTNDWLNPPAEGKQLKHSPSDLYKHGVDAHCGNKAAEPVRSSLEEPLKQRQYNHNLFKRNRNPFTKKSDQWSESANSEIASMLLAKKRLGAAIGASAHQDRSSQKGDNQHLGVDSRTFSPSLMDKIRQGSHKFFHRQQPSKNSDRGSDNSAIVSSLRDVAKPRGRDSLIRELTPQPPRVDQASIYHAMTGTRLVVNRKRGDTCSEDNRPHMCESDAERPLASLVM